MNNTKLFDIKRLNSTDLDTVLKLISLVTNQVENDTIYCPNDDEFFKEALCGSNIILGAYKDKTLVAFSATILHPCASINIGTDFGFNTDELLQSAQFEDCIVHPHYRGNGLQFILYKQTLSYLQSTALHFFFATVSPLNPASLQSFFKCNFVIKDLKYKYGGKLRFLLFRDVSRDFIPTSDSYEVLIDDTAHQQEVLADGYCGYQLIRASEGLKIRYGKSTES